MKYFTGALASFAYMLTIVYSPLFVAVAVILTFWTLDEIINNK